MCVYVCERVHVCANEALIHCKKAQMEGQNIYIRTINTGRACACRHCIYCASIYSFFSLFFEIKSFWRTVRLQ